MNPHTFRAMIKLLALIYEELAAARNGPSPRIKYVDGMPQALIYHGQDGTTTEVPL